MLNKIFWWFFLALQLFFVIMALRDVQSADEFIKGAQGDLFGIAYPVIIVAVAVGLAVYHSVVAIRQRSLVRGFLVVGLIGLVLAVNYYFRNPSPFSSPSNLEKFNPHIKDYIVQTRIQGTYEYPYIRGKVIPILSGAVFDDLYAALPEELRASTPDEVETIILAMCVKSLRGYYEDGAKAYATSCDLSIIDTVDSRRFDVYTPFSSLPPDSKRSFGDAIAPAPVWLMAEYIADLPQK